MTAKPDSLRLAGAIIFFAAIQWFMIVLAAETLFPNYSIMANDLSDLASTVPPNVSLIQPSAMLFNLTTFLFGLLIIVSSILILRVCNKRLFVALLAISGLAAMAVGVFPGDTGAIHGLVALAWFVTAPFSAIVAYGFLKKPFAYFSVAIGAFALIVLILTFSVGRASPFLLFGRGGVERMIVYPVIFWTAAFAGYLTNASSNES